MRSRFSLGFTLPQALQARLLGNHMGRVTWVCRHWPLASSSRAGFPYLRHLARAFDFPVGPHPRQERGGARLSQHGVTAPDDDAGTLISKVTIRAGIRFRQRRVAGPVSPSLHGVARAGTSRSRPPAWGSKFFKVITGFKFLAPCIEHPNPLPVEFRGTGVADVQCHAAREPRWYHDDSGVKPEALVNQPPLHTIRRWAGGLIGMVPAFGVWWTVVPEFPAGPLRGQWPFPVRHPGPVLLLGNDDRAKMALA